ncbi:MAG TPA: hypothetical protein VFL85_04475 [Candidatus Saccharimonadales bacterium]|nr:hypothetical protein [Candidatus Saccharimonadales bacterium]
MKKIITTCIIAATLCIVVYNDAVSGMLVALFVGGQVPFSDIVLPPRTIIGLTAGVIFLLVFAFLSRLSPKRQRGDERYHHHTHPSSSVPNIPVVNPAIATHPTQVHPTPVLAVSPVLYRRHDRLRIRRRYRVAHQIWRYRYGLRQRHASLLSHIHHANVKTRENFRHAILDMRYAIRYASRLAYRSVFGSVRAVLVGARRIWRLLSPHLWRFDAWLERQTHALGMAVSNTSRRNDTFDSVLDLVDETLGLLRLRK